LGPRSSEKDYHAAIEEVRLGLLMDPPPTSLDGSHGLTLDADVPFRALRPTSAEEEDKLQQMRDIQVKARIMLRCRRAPTKADLQALYYMFGTAWQQRPMLHAVAVTSMGELDTFPTELLTSMDDLD
jgi:hypothetical protein